MIFLTNRDLSKTIIDVDSKLSLVSKSAPTLTNEQVEVADVAAKTFENIFIEFKKTPILLDENNIKDLSKLVFDMYTVKLNLKKNEALRGDSSSKTAMNVENCLMNSLALLYPEESSSNFKAAEIIFEFLLGNILYDVSEEVIGQERPFGALPRLINQELLSKGISNTPELKKIAAMLYPLAILASFFDEKAKIPGVEKREMALTFDVETFLREYKAQFWDDCSDSWTGEFLVECIGTIWDSIEKNKKVQT